MKTMAAPSKEVARDNQVLKMVKTWQANVFYGIINTSHMIESIKRWHGSFCLFCFFYYLRLDRARQQAAVHAAGRRWVNLVDASDRAEPASAVVVVASHGHPRKLAALVHRSLLGVVLHARLHLGSQLLPRLPDGGAPHSGYGLGQPFAGASHLPVRPMVVCDGLA